MRISPSNSRIRVVLAVVIAVFFTASCQNVLDVDVEGIGSLPPGATGVRVSVGDNDLLRASTVLPNDPEFIGYRLEFDGPNGNGIDPIELTDGSTAAEVELTPGEWTITAFGVTEFDGDEVDVAEGEKVVDLEEGEHAEVHITIQAGIEGDKGRLEYELEIDSELGEVDYGLFWDLWGDHDGQLGRDHDSDGTAESQTVSGEADLSPGYYLLTVRIENGDDETSIKQRIVHVYSNMVSVATFSFSADDFLPDEDDPDDPDDDHDPTPGHLGDEFTLPAGVIEYWADDFGESAEVFAVTDSYPDQDTWGPVEVGEDGQFDGILVTAASEDVLEPVSIFTDDRSDLESSNDDTEFTLMYGLEYVHDDLRGFVDRGGLMVQIAWMYVDRDVDIWGTVRYDDDWYDESYDLNLAEGWNRVVSFVDEYEELIKIRVGAEPEGVVWYLDDWNDDWNEVDVSGDFSVDANFTSDLTHDGEPPFWDWLEFFADSELDHWIGDGFVKYDDHDEIEFWEGYMEEGDFQSVYVVAEVEVYLGSGEWEWRFYKSRDLGPLDTTSGDDADLDIVVDEDWVKLDDW